MLLSSSNIGPKLQVQKGATMLRTWVKPRLGVGKTFQGFIRSCSRLSKFSSRSHHCGELRGQHVGQRVQLSGWVQFIRMNKFILLKDAYGITQLQVEALDLEIRSLPLESVLTIEGVVMKRPEEGCNPSMATGEIEVVVDNVLDVSKADKIPFLSREYKKAKEATHMQYRYLALRDSRLQRNLRLRSDLIQSFRNFLTSHRFVDVDTPSLFKRTPGGAQEFVVPSRIPGKFYSLTQSPQQFKQLLMVGGLDRYFQIAKCFRDEGTKADRQPEFTQVDIELSFTDSEKVIKLVEEMLEDAWPCDGISTPFARMTYKEAMENYGTDKPDLRYPNRIINLTESAGRDEFMNNLVKPGWQVYGIEFKSSVVITQKLLKDIEKELFSHAKKVLGCQPVISFFIRKLSGEVQSGLLKKCSESFVTDVKNDLRLHEESIGFIVCGPMTEALTLMGLARTKLSNLCFEFVENDFKFVWIVDFPLFERDENGHLVSSHHPFTRPHPEDLELLDKNPGSVRGLHYDLVLNGQEVAGGSIRIHEADLQRKIIKDILNEDTGEFSHLLKALTYGCPPHGGIALGLDRLLAIMTHSQSIRDVIAFPKSADGKDVMSGAPIFISETEKKLYHINPVLPSLD